MTDEIITTTKIAVFRGKRIRKIIYRNEWYFSVIDVIATITESENPRDYWYKMKIRVESEEQAKLSTKCRQLKLESTDGKKYSTDCANTESMFRIIQSYPSPRGNVAGTARKKLEQETRQKVVSRKNYLTRQNIKELQ